MNNFNIKDIDKSNWKTYRFDKLASKISKRVNPNTTDLKIYVGLEHLDRESIHIRRHGTPADVKGEKLRCYPNDVIFGKRRAYQRKAAIVTFDGICSAHAFVLRANPEIIDPKLFPFFLHSDAFMHRMVDISVGGLSPTINWKNLKEQEFLLPPKDQQAQIIELLWALDKVVEKQFAVLNQLKILEKTYRNSRIKNLTSEEIKLRDLILPMSKIQVGKIDKSKYQNNGKYPVVDQSMNFIVGYTNEDHLVYNGDLPVLVFGDHTTIIKYIDFPFVMGADGTKVIKPNDDLDVYYLFQAIKEINIKPQGYRRHFSILKNQTIKVPKESKWITKFRLEMQAISKSISVMNLNIQASKNLQKSLINQIF